MNYKLVIQFAVLAVYLIIMLLIGLGFYKKNEDMADYFLGGRSLNKWVAAMSAQASDMSGWLLLGLPGTAYALFTGTTEAAWTAIGLLIGTYLNWLFVAKRLRKQTQVSNDSITLPVYFENRFKDKTKILRIASSVFIMVFFLVYTASQFAAGAKLFEAAFGVPYHIGLLIGGVIIIGYTFLGGFKAVAWTDLVQGIIMFCVIVVMPFLLIFKLGGWEQTAIQFKGMAAVTGEVFSWLPRDTGGTVNVLLLISSIGWGLGYFGQPHILTRFMAIRSSKEIQPARVIATVWVVLTLACAVIIGALGCLYVHAGMAGDLANLVAGDKEKIFMVLIQSIFGASNNVISIILCGVFLTAILAAIMSTADSQLLVTASSITEDFYCSVAKKEPSQKKMVWISRGAVIVVSLIAMLLAMKPESSVFELVSMAWGGFGAAFGPCILFSLYWRRMTVQGAIAGVLVGGISDLIWYFAQGGIFDVYELVPAFLLSCIAIVVFSLLTKLPDDVATQYDAAKTAEI
ncbi:sodium/proline symporter PutP [Ructibacterium gallinarum]|uniref:Sodium/proline symporter n=1 Tax=Ructibacterium gallinarum TaxID=2779355 RepID=A0A9D5RCK6_9FIRM|nr:sodium/proline symporter PutP [Ructibacterium gallinarum]MBE5041083.1 sodium/proline symporter PutP [Ructibacterium gallinarum]